MGAGVTPSTTFLKLNNHDWRVVGFHVIVAAVQAGLLALGTYHSLFGAYDPYVTLFVQVASEGIRRAVD